MASHRPLVLAVNGDVKQLPVGDYLVGTSAAVPNGNLMEMPALGAGLAEFYGSQGGVVTTSTAAQAADRLYMIPVCFGAYTTLTAMAIRVATAVASSLARVGVYNDAGGRPGTLLVEATVSAQFDCSGSTGVRKVTGMSTAITPGARYWLAFVTNSTPANIIQKATGVAMAGINLNTAGTAQQPAHYLYRAFTYAALPADESGSSWSVSTSAAQPLMGWSAT